MNDEYLKLNNQICFPFYALSRLLTKAYQNYLQPLELTYPQYLVMLVLWENDAVSVSEISKKLLLESNTLTPLLKRMEQNELISRKRCIQDERSVIVSLTNKGKQLKEPALSIPTSIYKCIAADDINLDKLLQTKTDVNNMIDILLRNKKNKSIVCDNNSSSD